MINKILLIAALVCLAEFSSCQTGVSSEDSAAVEKHRTDSLAEVKRKKDSANKANAVATEIKRKRDSTNKAVAAEVKRKTDSTNKAAAELKRRKDSTNKATAELKHRTDSSNKAAAAKKTQDSLETILQKRRSHPTKADSAAIIKELRSKLTFAENTALWLKITTGIFALAVVFFLFLFLKLLKVNRRRIQRIKTYERHIDGLKDFLSQRNLLDPRANYEAKEIYSETGELIDKYLHLLKAVPVPIPEKSGPANTSTTFVPYFAALPGSYIKTEIMLSAGPRKETENNDTELGEDVAGSISLPNHTYFWLLDGTSDSTNLSDGKGAEEDHLFSSRVLAQSIGYFIQKNIAQYNVDKAPLNELLIAAGNHVAAEIEKNLNNDQSGKKESIIAKIEKGHQLICSTTVIIGCLFANGRFYALRAGDSKVFPFKKSSDGLSLDKNFGFTSDPTSENDRIALGLGFDGATNTIKINQNKELKWLSQSAENIECVFAFTDGIGPVTETQLASNKPGIIEKIRENISRIPQKKQDDKTLIILERITTDK